MAIIIACASSSAVATTFTTSVPNTSLTLPSTYPQAGGVAIVLEGVNGNVYYQFVNPSTMFQGYQNTGTPAAWQGNPFQIGPVMSLYCGPIVSCSSYLGGGISRMTIRFTAYDGDNQVGQFDYNDLNLRINGSNFGASSGNWSIVPTQNTNTAGTTLVSSGTGFGNNTFDTGWFQSTDSTILANVLSSGSITASVYDRDPNDNFWDFRQGSDANTSTVPLNVAPGVTLDKASTTTSFSAVGEVIPYTFTYRNIGSVWINNIAVSDPKVTGVSCPAPPAAGTANLDPGEQVVCTANYTVTQADIDAGSIVNTATATGTPQAGTLGPISDSNTIPGPASSPSVTLTKTSSPSPFGIVGSTLTYAFAVTNTGNVTLNNISISDPSLIGLSCVSVSIAPGATTTLSCSGNSRTITQGNVDAGSISNTATVTARAPNSTIVSATSNISTAGPASAPAIAVVKSASAINDIDSNGPDAGDTITYSFAVSNRGNVTLTSVAVADPGVGAVSCPSSTLAPAASMNCTVVYTLLQSNFDAGSITNSATGSGNPPTGATVTDISGSTIGNNTPTVTTLPASPALTVDKTSSTSNFDAVGDTISYSYLVTNSGNVTLMNAITIQDNKTTVSCPSVPPAGLAPGGTLTCTASYLTTQANIDAGGVTNIAHAETTYGVANTPVVSPNDSQSVPAIQTPSMTISKTATSVAFVNIGDVVQYQYIVTNTGNVSLASPITVTDSRVSPVVCPPLPGGSLAPGSTLTCTSTYLVVLEDLDIGSVTNLAAASSGTTSSPQASVTIPAGASPALTLVKTSSASSFNTVGENITYSFLVTNTGNATFTRPISIIDNKIGTIACWTPTGSNPTFTPAAGATPAETATCTAIYTVTQADLDRGYVTNQAYGSTTYGAANIPVTSPPDSVTVNAVQDPELTVTKSAATLPITSVGQVLTYTIRAQNTGDVTLSSLTVTDPLIPSLSCSVASLAPAAIRTCVANYTVTQGDFDAGALNNVATAQAFAPQGAAVTDTGNHSATIAQNSSVTIAKTFVSNVDQDSSTSVTLNDTLNYVITVTNDGNISQSSVAITDTLLTPSNKTCAAVPPGGSCVLSGTLTVSQSQVDAGMVLNTASVTTALLPTPETVVRSVPVAQNSNLQVQKSSALNGDQDLSGTVSLNDVLTYNVTARNSGTVTQLNVVVTDTRITPNSKTCASVSPGNTCVLTGTKTVVQDDVDAGSIVNTGSATSTAFPSPITASVTTAIPQVSSIAISKSMVANADEDASSSLSLNDTLTYRVTVTNDGNIRQSNVVVSDPKLTPATFTCPTLALLQTCVLEGTLIVRQSDVDAGSINNTGSATTTLLPTPESASANGSIPQNAELTLDKTSSTASFDAVNDAISYTYVLTNTGNVSLVGTLAISDDKTTVVCPALPPGGLAPNASHTCSATYLATLADLNAGGVTNIARASIGSTLSATDTVTVPAVQQPQLSIDKTSPTPSYDAIGDVLTYSYLVQNIGNVTLTNPVTISDDRVAVLCPPLPGGILAPGGQITCGATYSVVQGDIDAGGVTNNAIANTTFGPGNTAVISAGDSVTVPAVQTPAMAVAKNATAIAFENVGDEVTYEYVVTNTGNTTIYTPISVSDNRVAPVNCPPLPVGGLSPGSSLTCTATYRVQLSDLDLGSITNLARASDGATTSPQVAETVPTGAAPALTIDKTSSTVGFATVGDQLVYNFLVTNSGNATFTRSISVVDDKIGTIACWTPGAADLTLTPAESVICTASYTVTQADLDQGYVTNQATANTVYGASNTAITSPPDSISINAAQNPALDVLKTASTLPVLAVGQVLTYGITTRNTGNVSIHNIIVTDPLIPALTCTITILSPGASQSCLGTYTVTQTDFDAGIITNVATARGVAPQGAAVTDTGTHSAPMVSASPAVNLNKVPATSAYSNVGDVVTFNFEVENSGNVTLRDLTVTDPLVPSFTCVISSLAPTLSDTSCSTSYIVTQADIDAGQINNTALVGATAVRGSDPADTATAVVPGPTRVPAVAVSKSASALTFDSVGDVISYDYVVTNTGNITLLGVVSVADDKIATVTCAALPVGGVPPGGTVNCSGSYSVTQSDLDAGQLTNIARATASTVLGTTTSPPGSVTATAIQTPGISLVKTAGAVSDLDNNGEDVGDSITYTLTVANTGNVTLTAIVVDDPKANPVTCATAILAPATSTTCSATYTLQQVDLDAGQVVNAAIASGTPPSGPIVTDESGTTPTGDDDTVTPINRSPAIAVVKTAGPLVDTDNNGADPGDTIEYHFAVSNQGNVTLASVAVSDPIVGSVNCPITSLIPTSSVICTATYSLTLDDINTGEVVNSATASGISPAGFAVTDTSGGSISDDTPTVTPLVQQPAITLIKAVSSIVDLDGNGQDAGDRIDYTFTVTNTGNVTLSSISVSDPMLGPTGCPTTSLLPSTFMDCAGSYVLRQGDIDLGTVVNSATVDARTPSNGTVTDISGNTDADDNATETAIAQSPSLMLSKTATVGSFDSVGDVLGYQYVVTNSGNVTISNAVNVTDNRAAVVCPPLPAGGLLPSQTLVCSANYSVTQADIDAGDVTNTADARSTFGPSAIDVISSTDDATVLAIQSPAMTVVKSATLVNFTNVGDEIDYLYVVANTGNTTLNGPITVTDDRVSVVNCPTGDLAPGASLNCTSTYTVLLEDLELGSVSNLAFASNAQTASPQTSLTVPPGSSPLLTLAKSSASPNFTAVGDILTYDFSITNSGGATFTRAISVSDNKIGVIACWSPSASDQTFTPGETINCSSSYVVTQADLDHGSVTNQASASTTYGGGNMPISSPPSSLTLNANQVPRLDVAKAVATLPISAVGQNLTYTITLTNSGNVSLSNITVIDPLVPGLTCDTTVLAVQAVAICTGNYHVRQVDFDAGAIINTATASAITPLGNAVPGSGTNTTTINQSPRITLVKTAGALNDLDGNGADMGDTIDYSFVVTNAGDVTLSTISVTDPKIGTIACPSTSLAPGLGFGCVATYTLTLADLDAGQVVNSAMVTSQSPQGTPISDRSGITSEDNLNTTTTLPAAPSISLVKTGGAIVDVDGNGPDVGDTITYVFNVINSGNQTLSSVNVTDALFSPPTLTCPTTALPPGSSTTCNATYVLQQADVDRGNITNQAYTTGRSPSNALVSDASGTNANNNTSTVVTIPRTSAIALLKIANGITDDDGNGPDEGDTVSYRFEVQNTGNVSLANVMVSDAKAVVAGGPIPSLAPGAVDGGTFTASYRLTQADVDAGRLTNSALVQGNPPTGPPTTDVSGTSFFNDADTTQEIPATPLLTLVKESGGINDIDGNGPDAGDTVSYIFTVRNRGNVTLSNVAINDPIVGVASLDAENGPNTAATLLAMAAADIDPLTTASTSQILAPNTNSLISTLGAKVSDSFFGSTPDVPQIATALSAKRQLIRLNDDQRPLAAGDRVGIYVVTINTGDGPLTHVAAVQDNAEEFGGSLPILSKNTSELLPVVFAYTVTEADIIAGKIVSGGRVTYHARDVLAVREFEDVLALSAVQPSGEMLTGSISPASIPTLLPGQTVVFSGLYTLTQVDIDAGNRSNTAVAAGGAPDGSSVADQSGADEASDAETQTPISRTPGIAVVKTAELIADADGNGPDVGDSIQYNFEISNVGNVTLTSLSIEDPKVGLVTCPASVSPATSAICSATYVLTQADVDSGEVRNTAIARGTAPDGTSVADTSGSTNADDNPTVTVVPRNGDITLTKVAGTPTTAAGADVTLVDTGDTIQYAFTLENTGNVTLSPISIVDAKIPTIVCPVNTLAPGENTVCIGNYALVQADFDIGTVDNTATGNGTSPDGSRASDVSGVSNSDDKPTETALPQTPRMTLVKTAAPPTTASGANTAITDVGDTVVYSFVATNVGNVTLSNLVIDDDKVPSIVCPVTSLAPQSTTTCQGTYVLLQDDLDAGQLVNTASGSASSPNGGVAEDISGTDPANDSPTNTPLPQVTLIGLVKTAGSPVDVDGNGVDAGDTIEYSFAVTNQGNVTLTAVSIDDPLISSAVPAGNVTCPAATLAPSTTMTCTTVYTLVQVNIDEGQVRNQATVSATPPIGPAITDKSDPQTPGQGPGENDATVTALTQTPGITLVKQADISGLAVPPLPGNKILYRFVVHNTGNVTLSDIAVADPLPGIVMTGAPTLSALAPDASDNSTFSAEYTITANDISAGFVVNTATVAGNFRDVNANILSAADTSGTDEANDTTTRVPLKAVPRITIVKTATFNELVPPASGANLGDTISYSFDVRNAGNVALTNVHIEDPMLSGISCPMSALAVGQNMSCTANDYALTQADINAGEVRNQAVASGNAVVDGQSTVVSDQSGASGADDQPTVTGLPMVLPTFTKTVSKSVVRIGEVVTYTIRATDVTFSPATIVDQLPGGLTYKPGTSVINGLASEPTVSARKLTFADVTPVAGEIVVTLRAVVNASATDGKYVNRAYLLHPDGRTIAEARAVVEVRPDPVFDCGDIIGKVFDDANGNGVQDASTSPYEPELGIPGVRVATVKGELITTDKNGKFHIACADIPDAKIGSNFILKLDPRSLPSGYRVTTENPRVVRLTKGKMTKINFGAAISRVIKLDLTDKVFVSGSLKVTPKLKAAVFKLVAVLEQDQSIVRLQYHMGEEGKAIAQKRLQLIADFIAQSWASSGGRYNLPIEQRLSLGQKSEVEQ